MNKITLEPVRLQDIGQHANMLQSGFWGALKSAFGWQAFVFKYNDAMSSPHSLLVLVRTLGAGQSLAYVPHGPMFPDTEALYSDKINEYWDLTAQLAALLKPLLPSSCLFIRFDPPWGLSFPAISKDPAAYPESDLSPEPVEGQKNIVLFYKARMDIQPPSTVILDLGKSEEELLAGMKSKTRYNIKLAAKRGVIVRTAGIDALPEWYELYRITAERDKIALHGYDYYEKIFLLAEELREADGDKSGAPEFRLLQAEIDGSVEAGIIISFQGSPGADRRATYLYGASSNNKRNYMPAYALQWEAIKQAAAADCTSYDFFGIPPADNPEHPMHGLYRFKTGFGGIILHRPGCWDYPYKKAAYTLFRTAEKARNYYYKTLRKR